MGTLDVGEVAASRFLFFSVVVHRRSGRDRREMRNDGRQSRQNLLYFVTSNRPRPSRGIVEI